ncbi:hypothetical protein Cadr_000029933, partial [Camelus dromedarius]
LAGDSDEEWLQEEMGSAAESLILSSRNITLIAQKLHLRPECQSHLEELVTTAQQILVATTKGRATHIVQVMSRYVDQDRDPIFRNGLRVLIQQLEQSEVHVLTDAVLDVAPILASSPKPSPSLSTRFELLCLELTLHAKALTGHLGNINADYEHALQDALCPKLSACKDPQTRPEISLERIVSGIQAVQGIVAGQESGSCQEDLPMALESILILTKEVAQRVPVLQEHPEDWLWWEWAAKAHHAVAQLQAWKGGHTKAWRLLIQCLKPSDEQDPAQPQPHPGEGASGAAAASSVDSQGAAPRDTPGRSKTAPPCSAPCCPARLHAERDPPLPEDGRVGSGNRISQITQQMAEEVLLMAQSLRRRGRILTKDQLITSARKIVTSGQNFAKLIHILAKNCVDQDAPRSSCVW